MGLRCAASAGRLTGVRNMSMDYKSAVMAQAETKVTTLDNGLRVATEYTPHQTATVGVYIDAGSRFETEANNGTAHFLEHMAFKGTTKRTQAALELEVENMGAMLNAYTSREMTTYYAKCLSKDIGHSTEILSDLLTNAKLDLNAIETERDVILREMQEVNNQPEEVVLDYLHATAYQGTSLGYTILGPEENIKSITQADLKEYIDTNYTGPRMVIAAAGGVDHDELVDLANEHFGGLSPELNESEGAKQCRYTGSELRDRDDNMPVAHVAFAVESVGHTHEDYWKMMVANSVVGNWDRSFGGSENLSSPLARITAEHNWAHSYTSFFTAYSDTSLWGTYAVLDPMKIEEFTWELQHEWMRLCRDVNEPDVTRAKNQLKAALAFASDGTTAVCDELGRQMLTHGRRVTALELDEQIEGITVDSVRAACDEYIYDQCPAIVAYGACEGLTDYNRVRNAMINFA